MAQKTIFEEIVDDFLDSLKGNTLIPKIILEKLEILREDKTPGSADIHSIIGLEEEK